MRHRSRSSLIALTLVLVLALAVPSNAFATIAQFDEDWIASATNPGKQDVYEVVWRENWGNDPLAQFEIKVPAPEPNEPAIVGGYYYLNRPASAPATITPGLWSQCYNSPVSDRDLWRLAVDLPGEFGRPGTLFDTGWAAPVSPDRPYEGPYSIFVQMIAKDTTQTARGHVTVGLDMTPPAKVTGLKAIPGAGDAPVNGWLKQSRVHLNWDDKVYDRLAGTGYFELYMDGKPYMTAVKDSKTSRRVYDLKEHYPGYGFTINTARSATVEDLPAGKHTVQVRAVDRATNAGPLSDPVTIQVDPDIPDIAVTWPKTNGQVIGAKPTFAATVKDLGGVKSVKFYVDGVLKATDTTSPYSAAVSLSGYANASSHTLRVVATDMADRTNFAESMFRIDKSVPVLSSISGAPNPFFPRKRDGYKDNFKVKFRASEAGTAKLTIKNSKGTVVRTVTKSVAAGSNSITWDGKYTSGSVKSGKFSWKVTLTDVAGNVGSTSTRTVSVKFYELVKTSSNRLRVIER